jgi:chemosensory pili system protein ChpA (sensor histidine kinase/response regulator)
MSDGFNKSDIVDFFLVEASEHLQILNDGLLSLEENNEDLSVVDEIFRSAHTIKGSAAMLGFIIISKLAHKMEDLLGKIRSRETSLSESVIDLLLQTVDTLTMQIEGIPNGIEEDESLLLMFTDLYAEFLEPSEETPETPIPQEAISPQGPSVEPTAESPLEEGIDDQELVESYELLQELEIPSALEETVQAAPSLSESKRAEPPEERTPVPGQEVQPTRKPRTAQKSMVSAGEKKFVRVGVEGLTELMNLVGELVINRTRLDQRIAYVNKLSYELNFSRDRLLKVIRDFKEKYEFGQVSDSAAVSPDQGGNGQGFDNGNQEDGILDGFFELEFDKYDDFNILSRSLVEIGSDISEVMNQLTDFFDQFEEESSQIRRITNDLQEEITNIRMVEVRQLFNKFHRTVRDIAKDESKIVSLKISGADARLDKTVVDEIADPLMHLIRNSVSHGIEAPDIREAKGKPREGEVALNAYKEGDNIIIEIEDNGNGINVERIREIIVAKGLRSVAEVESMPDDEIIKFIFAPGFSTKKDVSAISGRGVGMDVVKTNIARLNGSIDIKTELGKGTKFSIKLPLTLVIYAALLIECGGQEFAISLTSVEETARIPVSHIHSVGKRQVIKLRDQVLPIRRLNDILGYNHNSGAFSDQLYTPIVIVRSAEQTLALMVDDLIGREIIVIKPLGDYLKKVNLFSGATISGEGKVRLILDIPTIIEQELVSEIPGSRTSTTLQLGAEEYEEFEQSISEETKVPELLLVDDSISIRKVVGMFLSNAGYKVDAATDGVDAIEKISKLSYDLIITDLEMPRMHGYELIAEIRSNETMNNVPIIVLTSRAGDKHHKKAVELGANDYIVKPVDEDTLLQSVKTLLTR